MMHGLSLFIGLFGNLALLVILVAVYGFLRDRMGSYGGVHRQIYYGAAFGLIVVLCMRMGVVQTWGIRLDQRATFVILAGAFGGPLAAGIAAAAGLAYRVGMGGVGVPRGVLSFAIAFTAGCLLRFLRPRIDEPGKLALASIAAAAAQLLGFLPARDLETGWATAKMMALPFGATEAVGLFIGAVLLTREDRRREGLEELRATEAKYRDLFDSLPDIVYRIGPDGRIAMISPACRAILGFAPEELVGKPSASLYADASRKRAMDEALARAGRVRDFEIELLRPDGSAAAVSANARAILDAEGRALGVDGILRDVSALKRAEAALRASLDERDALLMELYHRANNNMQIISSYLRLQAEALEDPKVESLAANLTARIHAMSLVYEKLYRSKSLSRINAREYIEELVPLAEAYDGGAVGSRIRVELEAEDIDFQVDSAVPLGLVLGELLGNSFRHAFPGGRRGTIRIALSRIDEGTILLVVSDDGVGLPAGFDPMTTTSFGLSTMVSIVKQQMRGSVEVRGGRGLEYRITMRDKLYPERV